MNKNLQIYKCLHEFNHQFQHLLTTAQLDSVWWCPICGATMTVYYKDNSSTIRMPECTAPGSPQNLGGIIHDDYRNEIEKYIPSIRVMSFAGAQCTCKWLFDKVTIKEEFLPKKVP